MTEDGEALSPSTDNAAHAISAGEEVCLFLLCKMHSMVEWLCSSVWVYEAFAAEREPLSPKKILCKESAAVMMQVLRHFWDLASLEEVSTRPADGQVFCSSEFNASQFLPLIDPNPTFLMCSRYVQMQPHRWWRIWSSLNRHMRAMATAT